MVPWLCKEIAITIQVSSVWKKKLYALSSSELQSEEWGGVTHKSRIQSYDVAWNLILSTYNASVCKRLWDEAAASLKGWSDSQIEELNLILWRRLNHICVTIMCCNILQHSSSNELIWAAFFGSSSTGRLVIFLVQNKSHGKVRNVTLYSSSGEPMVEEVVGSDSLQSEQV